MGNKRRDRKKRMTIIIGIVAILGIIMGGKMYMDNKQQQAEREKIAVERQSIEVLKKTFANIKQVDIEKTGYNDMTGAYRMFVTMTDTKEESVYFTYSFWKERNEIGGYGVEDESVQKEGTTDTKIHVIHSSGAEEDI